MLRATWYERTAQLLSLTELRSHLFELYFIGWTIKPMKEGRKPEYSEKTPGDELQISHLRECRFPIWENAGFPFERIHVSHLGEYLFPIWENTGFPFGRILISHLREYRFPIWENTCFPFERIQVSHLRGYRCPILCWQAAWWRTPSSCAGKAAASPLRKCQEPLASLTQRASAMVAPTATTLWTASSLWSGCCPSSSSSSCTGPFTLR